MIFPNCLMIIKLSVLPYEADCTISMPDMTLNILICVPYTWNGTVEFENLSSSGVNVIRIRFCCIAEHSLLTCSILPKLIWNKCGFSHFGNYMVPSYSDGWKLRTFKMPSSNGNIFHVTGPLWGEIHRSPMLSLTKASDAELWFFRIESHVIRNFTKISQCRETK